MIIVKNKLIPWGTFVALTIGPFIFTKRDTVGERTLRHESIHWEQYKETLIVGFLLIYLLDWLWEALRCSLDHSRGARADGRYRPLRKRMYRSLLFEREAYAHQDDVEYLNTRHHYAWAKEKYIVYQ